MDARVWGFALGHLNGRDAQAPNVRLGIVAHLAGHVSRAKIVLITITMLTNTTGTVHM